MDLFSCILTATPSAAGPSWLCRVAIWGVRCFHFDILGDHFGISGALWGAILAPRDRSGGPWEQQDGLEVVNNRTCVDFGVISGFVYIGFWVKNALQIVLFVGLFPGHFVH